MVEEELRKPSSTISLVLDTSNQQSSYGVYKPQAHVTSTQWLIICIVLPVGEYFVHLLKIARSGSAAVYYTNVYSRSCSEHSVIFLCMLL